jgi:Ca-activated chloride channel family protein
MSKLFNYIFYFFEILFEGRFAFHRALYLLILIPLLILGLVMAFRAKRRQMARFGNLALVEKLVTSVNRRAQVLKSGLLIFSLLFLILALARPQLGKKMREVRRHGQNIMVALDVSLSMLARDIQPSRLERAKLDIARFIDKLQGDRIGLVAFAGESFVQCPLTMDYSSVRMFLNSMGPDLIPVPGTGIAKAIDKVSSSLSEEDKKYKVMVLITDGEDHQGDPVKSAENAAREGLVVYTVGVGSDRGSPIPLGSGNQQSMGFKKDRGGEVVMSRLDSYTLKRIALKTGGNYYHMTPAGGAMDSVYKQISDMEKKELGSRQFAHNEDRFQPFVGLAVLCLILELVIPERKRKMREWKGRFL